MNRREKLFDHLRAQSLLGPEHALPPAGLRAEPRKSDLLAVRSRVAHKPTATHDVYEHYECVGGIMLLMKVERIAR